MMWPEKGVVIFTYLAGVPPLIALLRREIASFAASLLISVLAAMLARYAYLVPIAIPLLIFAFWVAFRNLKYNSAFVWKGAAFLFALSFMAIAVHAFKLSLMYNWSPPQIFEHALDSRLLDREHAMTATLNSQFPVGTDEAALISALSKQGFAKVQVPRPLCRQPDRGPQVIAYAPCPAGSQEMTYEYEQIGLLCGTRYISINWSTDPSGKITRLAATRTLSCL